MFDAVRAAVTARQAAERYGLEIDRHGRARCVWHSPDRNPSLGFKDGFCHCFACGNGGSSIDLTARLFDLSPVEAARKLQQDFGLGSAGGHFIRRDTSRAQRRQAAETWRRERWAFLCDVEQEARAELARFPAADESWESPRFRAVLSAFARVQIELDRLHTADITEIEAMWQGRARHAERRA